MKKIAIIGLLLAAGIGIVVYYKKESDLLSKFKVDLEDYKITDFTLGNMNLVLKFKITSYNSIEGQIVGSNMDIYLNGAYVGNAFNSTPLTIPAQGYNFADVNLKVNNGQLVKDAVDIITGDKNAPIEIRIIGTVKVKTGWIGINIPVDSIQTTSLAELLKP